MSKQKRFKIDDVVKLTTDQEGLPRIITRKEVSKQGTTYCLSQGITISWHFASEIDYFQPTRQIGLKA